MREARSRAPGEVHHVISRFIESRYFLETEEQRAHYLRLFGKAMKQTDWVCISYALMSSHLHHAFVAGERAASSWSRRVNAPFANWYNEVHERTGALFGARAKMWIARPQNVGAVIAYIHNNPVRAGVVRRASQSTWTSHRAYIGAADAPPWLHCQRGLQLSGLSADEFDDWVHTRRKMKRDDPSLQEIDRETRRLGSIVLGTPKIEPLEVPLLVRHGAHLRPSPARVVEIVAEVLGLERGEMFDRRRGGRGAVGRTIAIQVGARFGIPMSAVGDAVGIRKSAAARHGERPLDERSARAAALISERLLLEMRLRDA
jgi:hypothetical protein